MKNIMKLFLVLIVLGSIGFTSEDNLTKSISVKN